MYYIVLRVYLPAEQKTSAIPLPTVCGWVAAVLGGAVMTGWRRRMPHQCLQGFQPFLSVSANDQCAHHCPCKTRSAQPGPRTDPHRWI